MQINMTPTEAVNYLAQVTPALPVPLPVHQQILLALEVLRRELQPKAPTPVVVKAHADT